MNRDDPCRNYHRNADTSAEAWEMIKRRTQTMREQIQALIEAHPAGLCCFEIESITGLSHQTASARITELKKLGLIFDNGLRRKGPGGGASSRVYQASFGNADIQVRIF